MIQYDNTQTFRILFRQAGSVLPRSMPTGLLTFSLGTSLAVIRYLGLTVAVFGAEDYLTTPLSIRVTGVAVAFCLVTRTNMALDRWMNAITEVEIMLCKWVDAFNALNSFFAGRHGTEEEAQRINMFRVRVAHWFSLMAACAFALFRSRGSAQLDVTPLDPKYPYVPDEDGLGPRCNKRNSYSRFGGPKHKAIKILHMPSPSEANVLEKCDDKVNVICLWIIQAIVKETREMEASRQLLDVPAPIVTRVFQEISSGMLGFHQAHKVAVVPFPFPFAQLVSLTLLVLFTLFPFYIDNFTKNVIMTPLISFIVPMCYCGLNLLSIELEDPFAYNSNEIELEAMNVEFIGMLEDTLWGDTKPPADPQNIMARTVTEEIEMKKRRILEALSSNGPSVASCCSSDRATESTFGDLAPSIFGRPSSSWRQSPVELLQASGETGTPRISGASTAVPSCADTALSLGRHTSPDESWQLSTRPSHQSQRSTRTMTSQLQSLPQSPGQSPRSPASPTRLLAHGGATGSRSGAADKEMVQRLTAQWIQASLGNSQKRSQEPASPQLGASLFAQASAKANHVAQASASEVVLAPIPGCSPSPRSVISQNSVPAADPSPDQDEQALSKCSPLERGRTAQLLRRGRSPSNSSELRPMKMTSL